MPPYRKSPPPHGRCTAPAAAPPARYSAPHILRPHILRHISCSLIICSLIICGHIFCGQIFCAPFSARAQHAVPLNGNSPFSGQSSRGSAPPPRVRKAMPASHGPGTAPSQAISQQAQISPFIGAVSIYTRGKDQFFSQKDKKSLSLSRCNRPPRGFPCPFRASHHPPHTIFITHLYQRKDSS